MTEEVQYSFILLKTQKRLAAPDCSLLRGLLPVIVAPEIKVLAAKILSPDNVELVWIGSVEALTIYTHNDQRPFHDEHSLGVENPLGWETDPDAWKIYNEVYSKLLQEVGLPNGIDEHVESYFRRRNPNHTITMLTSTGVQNNIIYYMTKEQLHCGSFLDKTFEPKLLCAHDRGLTFKNHDKATPVVNLCAEL